MRRFLVVCAGLSLGVASATAEPIALHGRLEQGGIVFGTVAPGTGVTLDGRTVSVSNTGRFVFGIDRDAKPSAMLVMRDESGVETKQVVSVAPRDWLIERVDGLPQSTVTPNPETVKRIRAEGGLIVAARNRTEPLPFFETGFLQPAQGRISGVFGSQRILNGQPRSPHSGLDIAAPTGTPILATADGVVSLVHDGMVLTGKTVMIDHGFGLDSVYIHMSEISVEQGQAVRQGDPIGAIGMTGRTNGPHLHFGISWYGAKLDPQTVMAALPAGQDILQ
ncbi:MAG: peptidoglycan DD-metalloendopeptidase family protein [Alphaproteobacteria bacterium]|nr:peptidoglycan DD-metalloendopeptidase family protein [Alphaproteobacteria bacterium]